MKLYELLESEYIKLDGYNIACVLTIETDEISKRFGHRYNGALIRMGGVTGHINDIPCYLGGCDVLSFRYTKRFGERELGLEISI